MAAAGGKTGNGLGFYVSDHNVKTFVDIGAFISAIIYFVIFMAVVYFIILCPTSTFRPGAVKWCSATRRP